MQFQMYDLLLCCICFFIYLMDFFFLYRVAERLNRTLRENSDFKRRVISLVFHLFYSEFINLLLSRIRENCYSVISGRIYAHTFSTGRRPSVYFKSELLHLNLIVYLPSFLLSRIIVCFCVVYWIPSIKI